MGILLILLNIACIIMLYAHEQFAFALLNYAAIGVLIAAETR